MTGAARPGLTPEGAANGGVTFPRRAATGPRPARLWDGHLSADCARRGGGAPACPACLAAQLGAGSHPTPG